MNVSQRSLLDVIERDICRRKHKGSVESEAAHQKVRFQKREMYARIETVMRNRTMTSKEIATELDKPLHTISGRLAELKSLNRIVKTGIVRDGAAELRLRA